MSDEQKVYWTDDGNCVWDNRCIQQSITVGGLPYVPINPGVSALPTPFSGLVTNAATYDYQAQGAPLPNDSPYSGNVTINDDG